MYRLRRIAQFCVLAAASLLAVAPCSAAVIYQVTVNTGGPNGVSGQSGNLNFQFNPGGDSQAATVEISGFSTVGGTFDGAPSTTGDVTGTLPGTVTLQNGSAFNDYFHPFTFGSSFQFLLTFSGPAITSPNGTSTSGSTFGIALFNAAGDTTLLTTDPSGFAATVDILLDGTTNPTPFDSATNTPSVVTFSLVNSAEIPEPATYATVASALLALGLYSRRRRIQ